MPGDYSPKRNSLLWGANPTLAAATLALPVLAGFTAIGLHGAFRYPMNIPGHHGLEFMALLTGTLLLSRRPGSGYLFSIGAGIAMPVFGILNPLNMVSYLVPGIMAALLRMPLRRTWLTALAGGLAYAGIPLLRMAAHLLLGIPVASFAKFGYIIPMASFFFFGLLGSLVATGLVHVTRDMPRKSS